jgi:hypothetical protein
MTTLRTPHTSTLATTLTLAAALISCALAPHSAHAAPTRQASGLTQTKPLRDFVAGSYRQIRAAHHGQPLLIAFWSMDCAHCPSSLRTLAASRAHYPALRIALVSTDNGAAPASVQAHITELDLHTAEQWRFADPIPERLRQEIDPRWWGELPRTVFISASGEHTAHSGALSAAQIAQWMRDGR